MNDEVDELWDDAALEAAIGWFERVRATSAAAEDWAALTVWLESSPTHLAAFEIVERISMEISEGATELLALQGRRSAQILSFPPRRPSAGRARSLPAIRIAAAAALVMALGVGVWRLSSGPLQIYRTGPGETRSVALADGSRIALDSSTTVSARLGWFSRQLRLGDGEASFDIAKNANRPLFVTVGDQRVRVVGTEFNIGDFDGTIDVTVRRGTVTVYQPGEGDAPVARLTSGLELEHRVGAATSVVQHVDADDAFAWMSGRLICNDEPLPRIAAYLNRRYGTPLRLSQLAAGKRFSGVLELGDQDDVVRHIAAYLSLAVHRSREEIRLD